jgi:hypothetical protein
MIVHIAKVVDVKREADTSISVCVACCDAVGPTLENPKAEDTRSWITIDTVHAKDPAKIRSEIATHLANVEAKHMGRELGEEVARNLIGMTKADFE